MNEDQYEKHLQIKTVGTQKWNDKSTLYSPYEPTSYEALHTLITHFPISSTDVAVDYGCGKGRLLFFLHHYTGATVKGVEFSAPYCAEIEENYLRYTKKHKARPSDIRWECISAQEYHVEAAQNLFYFFNPFGLPIFRGVISQILDSLATYPRKASLILYYPSEEYLYFLDHETSFERTKEIPIPRISTKNPREIFVIYTYYPS